jgi:phospholipid/cholesterol/gamma-HCH transport system ATP-binding protein
MSEPAESRRGVRVEVRGLCKSFDGQPVLREVNLDIRPGEIFVIMGPSGAGKSLLLRQIIGLDAPDAGEILIDGEPIHQPGVRDKHRLAMVFQSGALLNSLTVGENVGLYLTEHRLKPPAEIERIVSEKLALVGLEGLEAKTPAQLSGGMKKRVAIARALVVEPNLILYDEPTGELDPLMAVTIGEEILSLKDRVPVTSIVVSHDRDFAFGVADRIAIISAGQILMIGAPPEIRQSGEPLIREFLNANLNPK